MLFSKYLRVILLSIVMFWNLSSAASNISCYCNNEHGAGHEQRVCINNRCTPSENSYCYAMKINAEGLVEKGCIFFSLCQLYKVREKKSGKQLIHCCETNMCNKNISVTNFSYVKLFTTHHTPGNNLQPTKKSSALLSTLQITLFVVLPVTLGFAMTIVFCICKHRKKTRSECSNSLVLHICPDPDDSLLQLSSSGSGFGVSVLAQKTIAAEIKLTKQIGNGKFGNVFHGLWRGQDVAVKVFSSSEENSWSREVKIYQTPMLRHENLLGFIAADNKDTGSCTQHWIVTEYHPSGSLYDFLHVKTLDLSTMSTMLLGMVSGLLHLHTEILGTVGKPAMAHRDIKTKNILVKRNNTCCIADLGLTVMHSSIQNHTDLPQSIKTGTRRYQSPEILDGSLDLQDFPAYRRADIYALGLCMWEVCNRTEIGGIVHEYHLPYYDVVHPDPTLEEMKQAICVEEKRPSFPDHWRPNQSMQVLMKTMTECWYDESTARLPALRVMKNLSSHFLTTE